MTRKIIKTGAFENLLSYFSGVCEYYVPNQEEFK